MFRAFSGKTPEGSEGYFQAIMRSQAVIEFKPDGTILTANENFLRTMGYTLSEIVGRHHSMFAAPDYAAGSDYRTFWDRLNRGEFVADKFQRLGKDGKEVWIQGSYNPITDKTGKVVKVVKFATDVTAQEQIARAATFKGAAFDTSPVPMIVADREFNITYVNGSLVKMLKDNLANFRSVFPNFNPDNLIGQNIDIFHKNPAHQRQLLSDHTRLPFNRDTTMGDMKFGLNASAVYDQGRKCVGYVVEFPDVTADRLNAGMLDALSRSQAIIEFNIDGTITNANDNFCQTVGYALSEIKGKHHSLFVEAAYSQSQEYRGFWEALGRGEFQSAKYLRIGRGGQGNLDSSYLQPNLRPERQSL